MSKKANNMSPTVVPVDELMRGYGMAIDNAIQCFYVSSELFSKFPSKSLAIAQIGQEEVGKSLTLLAGGALSDSPEDWKEFWASWRKHEVKSHRAFLYEIIIQTRIEVPRPEGTYSGQSLKDTIPQEKESGLYVDFDHERRVFISPVDEADAEMASCRLSTLTYLVAVADMIRKVLFMENALFRFTEFAKIARLICTTEIYQQDWDRLSAEFAAQSKEHADIVVELVDAENGIKDYFSNLLPKD